jgi:acetyl esterase/lipase
MARTLSHWEAFIGVAIFFGFLAYLACSREEPSAYEFKATFTDVSYGPAQQQALDFYQARTDRPAPLVAYFHSGSFISGDKSDCHAGLVNVLNESGIHFATVNYRYADGKQVLFPEPQRDGARAVQFLRSKAREWNIDPQRIACFGESAGAGISLWIGFHDDLADPDNPDPVLRESSRIAVVGNLEGQTTYDPVKIKELIGGRAWEHPSLYKNFGVHSAEEALRPSPAMQRLYDDASAISMLTEDDPPVFMVYEEPEGPLRPDAGPGAGIHHPNFGRLLKARMDELGIDNVFISLDGGNDMPIDYFPEMLEFFQRRLSDENAAAHP